MGSVPPKCYYLQMLSSKPRITIVHGWGDDVSQGWIAWLVTQLRTEGYDAVAPQFPRERLAKTDFHTWMNLLKVRLEPLQPGDIIVAHSMGVPMVLRYLSDYQGAPSIAGLICVAGVADHHVMRPNPLFDPPLKFDKIIGMAKQRISIYSDNDRSVPRRYTDELAEKLQAVPILDSGKGHFSGLRGLTELPSALEAVHRCIE